MKYNILLITSFDKPWADGWYYQTGFEINGHKVIPFDPAASEDPLAGINKIIKEHRPEFILHTKDELPAEAYQEMRTSAKVIQWYPDPVIPDWLPPYVRAADVFFTMSEGLVEELKELNPKTFWMTQAFEPSAFQIEGITGEDIRNFSADITFVGNLGSKPRYLPRREYLMSVLNNGFNLKWWGPKIPFKLSTARLIMGGLGRSYGGRIIWGGDHAKVAKLSKIYLGFDAAPEVRKSMSERMYIAVGCGAFYMCQYVNGIEEVLEPGKEIVTFHSGEEMVELIRYYLIHDNERKIIAEAGQKRVMNEHTYETRTGQIIKIIEDII